MFGIMLFYKPVTWTSNDVVRKLQILLKTKKIGHGGALDPMAEGVLIMGIEKEGTQVLSSILNHTYKTYQAVITLGVTSSTDDSEGDLTMVSDHKIPAQVEVEKCLENFIGAILQTPPKYSAIKIGGVAAYKRARQGQDLSYLQPKEVFVEEIILKKYFYPEIIVEITCGSGFYVRSLARDVGGALGTGGHLTSLQRTRIFDPQNSEIDFKLEDCVTFDDLKNDFLEMDIVVTGKVQGVGFRMFAEEIARSLELVGRAENKPKDALEIIVQGKKEGLNAFLEKVKIGPALAQISALSVFFRKPKEKFLAFTIQ